MPMQPKYQLVAGTLREEIRSGRYRDTMLLPTEYELCSQFHMSRQTVRQALSLLASEGLIERRQGSGSHILATPNPSSRPRRTVAVVTTYISNYIFPTILREIETVLAANNGAPTLFATQNQIGNERRILQTLLDGELPDGILVEGTKTGLPSPNLDLYAQLRQRGVPMIFMHGFYREMEEPVLTVTDDNRGGGRQLVEYLHQKGHTAIGGFFKSDDLQGLERYAGYAAAMRDLGLPLVDRHVFWYNTEHRERLLSDDQYCQQLLSIFKHCTALVCYNDEIAARLIAMFLKRGVRVPEDMAVVSFDDSPFCEISPVPVTSLSHGHQNAGRVAADLLMRMMQGEPCESQVIPWQLMTRQSG